MRGRFAPRTAAIAALLTLPLLAGAVPAAAAGQRPAGEHGHGAYRKVGYFTQWGWSFSLQCEHS